MQTFVQCPKTNTFFDVQQNQWTPRRDCATGFQHSAEAIAFCLNHGLSEVQFVLEVDDPSTPDVVVPFA